MKLRVLEGERFTCQSCTQCCRNWFVELMPGEAEKITSLQWGENDPLSRTGHLLHHGGKTFLARQADGACLFLNPTNGLCRIHERFGVDAKPLGCRMFPYQAAPAFAGEVTILGRYDCPTVRKNLGAPYEAAVPELRTLVARLDVPAGFDERTACHLSRDQIKAVCEFLDVMLGGFRSNAQRAVFILFLCEVLAGTGVENLSREALGAALPGLRRLVESTVSDAQRKPNWFVRMAFRTLLGLYLRRDEDVVVGKASRLGRTAALAGLVLGSGNFRRLGASHRRGSLRAARLFRGGMEVDDAETFELLWRLVRNRLDAFQFMGRVNGGRDFLSGLRSLALLYPLVAASAKYHAAARKSDRVGPEDVDLAVEIIEHSYGRLPVLAQPSTRMMEKLLTEQRTFVRLASTI